MTLKQWFQKHHTRPLKIAAIFFLAVWSVFAVRSYWVIEAKQNTYVTQTADLLSIAVYQKNRVLAESLLETLLSQGGASSAEICEGDKQIIGVNSSLLGCRQKSLFHERLIEQTLPGSGQLVLRAKFNIFASFSSIFSGLGFALILVFIGFYFIQTAQYRMKKDLFDPILNKLLGKETLEIQELSDLRKTIEEAKVLEAQKAVTLAIQEHNQQVAHDIRSPIESIAALLTMVEIKDFKLKSALEKALERARSVSNGLLKAEKISEETQKEFVFDISSVLQDIATEKRPIFQGGSIEVQTPPALMIKSSLSMDLFSRILSNIVDNAILACSEERNVSISLRQGVDWVEVQIKDMGAGIAPEVLKRIGEKGFSQRSSSLIPGTGRGVYSAKKALSEIGGRIEFSSILGKGTAVSIRIPCQIQSQSLDSADAVVIDNDKIVQMTWELWAEENGLALRCFSSVEEFVKKSSDFPKEVPVFLDSDLGNGLKGQSYIPQLKEMGFEKVILATAYEHLHQEKFHGVEAVIGKSPAEAFKFICHRRSDSSAVEAVSAHA